MSQKFKKRYPSQKFKKRYPSQSLFHHMIQPLIVLIMICICIFIFICIMILERPLDTTDFMQYIKPRTNSNLMFDRADRADRAIITSDQLKYIDPNLIPNLTDFMEDDKHVD